MSYILVKIVYKSNDIIYHHILDYYRQLIDKKKARLISLALKIGYSSSKGGGLQYKAEAIIYA